MVYIGVDPGATGGIAAVDDVGTILRVCAMPPTEADILLALNACGPAEHAFAVIERVHAFPKMGVVSAFTFGQGYGGLLMALTAVGVRFDIVQPKKWQQALACLSGGDKNVTKRRAQQLFPDAKITHAVADALLMAEYCRRVHGVQTHGQESRRKEEGAEAAGTSAQSGVRFVETYDVDREGVRAQAQRPALADPARHGSRAQRQAR